MSKETQPATSPEIADIALQLFAERSSRTLGRGIQQVAMQSFRDAEAFLKVRAMHSAGELAIAEETSVLSDCFCPNQKKTHPHNLVSQELGDLNRVKKIFAALEANPQMKTYDEMDWDEPTTNLARTIFPHYAKAAASN